MPDAGTRDDGNRADDPYEKAFLEAINLRDSGRLRESSDNLKTIVEGRTRLHGRNHDLTQFALSQLGRTLRAMGELEAARRLHEEVLEIRRRLLGNEHEWTRNSMRNLADTLEKCGEHAAAAILRSEANSAPTADTPSRGVKDNGMLSGPHHSLGAVRALDVRAVYPFMFKPPR